jgi:hypothetical protein
MPEPPQSQADRVISVFEDVPQQIEVLNHRGKSLTTKPAPEEET